MNTIEPARKTRKITDMFGLAMSSPSTSVEAPASAVRGPAVTAAAAAASETTNKEMKGVLVSFFKVLGKADDQAKPIAIKTFRNFFAKVFGWTISETDGTCGLVIREVFSLGVEGEESVGGGVSITKPRNGTLVHGLTIRDSPTPAIKQAVHKLHQDWVRICSALKAPYNESIKWGSVLRAVSDGENSSLSAAKAKPSSIHVYPPVVVQYS